MRYLRFFLICSIGLMALAPIFGAETLAESEEATILDGSVSENEYSYTASFDRGRVDLFLNWNEDVLSAGIVGDTKGWVAVGFNSLRMDGALILFGFVDGDDVNFRVDSGRGHQHTQTDDTDVLGYFLSEDSGTTTMEIELTAGDFIAAGADELQVILAYGNQDSFSAVHRFRTPHSVELANR